MLSALLLTLVSAVQPGSSPDAARAEKAVAEFLAKHKGENARVAVIADCSELPKAFPGRQFVAVHFAEWPVAVAAPKPLTSRNLFVVDKDGKLLHLTDAAGLTKFFQDNVPPLKPGTNPRDLVEIYLRLSQEFQQDGFYKFQIDPNEFYGFTASDGTSMKGGITKVVPEMGNKGLLKAELWFDAAGKIDKIGEKVEINRGVRPRCQATRLLDADPVIREICEQDLLVMGRAAHDYLMEQRAKASPALQQEIDRVWRRILAEKR